MFQFSTTVKCMVSDLVYQLCDSAFEHILVHAFTLLQSNLCRDRDVVLCYICKPSDPV